MPLAINLSADQARDVLIKNGYNLTDANRVIDAAVEDVGTHYCAEGNDVWVTCVVWGMSDGELDYCFEVSDDIPVGGRF